jgi:hypothetical protein
MATCPVLALGDRSPKPHAGPKGKREGADHLTSKPPSDLNLDRLLTYTWRTRTGEIADINNLESDPKLVRISCGPK